jgi:hypothetical protein
MRDFGKKKDIDSQHYIQRKKSFVNQAIHNLVEAAVDEGIEGYKDSFKTPSYDEQKRRRAQEEAAAERSSNYGDQ